VRYIYMLDKERHPEAIVLGESCKEFGEAPEQCSCLRLLPRRPLQRTCIRLLHLESKGVWRLLRELECRCLTLCSRTGKDQEKEQMIEFNGSSRI
jgi:hypothetical protein